ncbi:MAG: hypothetical protein KDA58_07955 [Planctomycetaceae bacterium]|nr:hypothetical protein [Planctomycetaceae bacterium]
MKIAFTFTLLASSLCLITIGCAPAPAPSPPANQTTSGDGHDHGAHEHAHPTEGPHHGSLIELGNEEYHAELVHDTESVTIYILDAAAKVAVPISTANITINAVVDDMPRQFELAANPDAGDPAGQSSRFQLTDAELVKTLDSETAQPKLNVVINDEPFRGTISHDHDHGHEH